MTWDEAAAYATTLDGAEFSTSYNRPAVKANGRVIIAVGHEPGSFVLHVDRNTKAMLMETEPATYWETPHYAGYAAVLVREDADDEQRVRPMITQTHAQALASRRRRR